MRVSPSLEVFVANVQPAHEPEHAVRHHDLPVIAEVEAEAPQPAPRSAELRHHRSSISQFSRITTWERVTAHVIVEQKDLHATSRGSDQSILELLSDAIVLDDVELGQYVFSCAVDRGKDCIER